MSLVMHARTRRAVRLYACIRSFRFVCSRHVFLFLVSFLVLCRFSLLDFCLTAHASAILPIAAPPPPSDHHLSFVSVARSPLDTLLDHLLC